MLVSVAEWWSLLTEDGPSCFYSFLCLNYVQLTLIFSPLSFSPPNRAIEHPNNIKAVLNQPFPLEFKSKQKLCLLSQLQIIFTKSVATNEINDTQYMFPEVSVHEIQTVAKNLKPSQIYRTWEQWRKCAPAHLGSNGDLLFCYL